MVALKASFTAVVVTTLAALVHGHGYMSVPKCEYTFEGDTTQFMATIEASASGFSGSFSGSPADNTAAFAKGFEASKYTSLKEMVSDLGKVYTNCAALEKTTSTGAASKYAVGGSPSTPTASTESSAATTTSTEGSDEASTTTVTTEAPATQTTTAPAATTAAPTVTTAPSTEVFTWLKRIAALSPVYINCAALEKTTSSGATSKFAVGGGGGGTSNSTTPATDSSSSEQTTDASAASAASAATDAPTVTEAPSSPASPATDAPSSPATDAPATPSSPATDAPATTEAPATDSPVVTSAPETGASQTSDKCSVRRRRRN
ncbi:hypothetical protein KRP22_014459 [Phytophthora ramorum]|nr:hypothetical protein KRP22_8937 [Phytophthora ramorum]